MIKHIDESKDRTKRLEGIDYRTAYAVLYEYMERSGVRCTPRKEERDSVTKYDDKTETEPSIPVSTITVTYKIDKEKMRLLGCQGIYEVSNWICENCTEQQRLSCRTLLNKHPDMAGRLIA